MSTRLLSAGASPPPMPALLCREPTTRVGIKAQRLKASWSDDHLAAVLRASDAIALGWGMRVTCPPVYHVYEPGAPAAWGRRPAHRHPSPRLTEPRPEGCPMIVNIDALLPRVSKPARYTGGEENGVACDGK